MVCRMEVPCEQDREGVEDFVLLTPVVLCVLVDEFECLCDRVVCIMTGETSVDEVVLHVHYDESCILHVL